MNNKKQILCVEDDAAILMPLRYALEREEWQVTWANTGSQAITFVQQQTFDFIILDVGLPDINGFDVCKKIRQFNHTPLLFLTARDDEIDRIVGLEIGADDYVNKPISPKVLVSRVNALFRRVSTKETSSVMQFGTMRIDTTKFMVTIGGDEKVLAKKEFELLHLLASRPGRVFLRNEILSQIWGNEVIVGDRTIDVNIRKIRQKLGIDCITTVKGVGYKFDLP